MYVVTLRMPEGKHERLKSLAKARGVSVNKLLDEMSTIALSQYDAEVSFLARSARGSAERGVALLDKLDKSFKRRTKRAAKRSLLD